MKSDASLKLWLNPDGTVFFEDPEASAILLAQALEPDFAWPSPVQWEYRGALGRTRRRSGVAQGVADLWVLHQSLLSVEPKPGGVTGETNLLDVKRAIARQMMERCDLCAHHCGVNRLLDTRGPCGTGMHSYFASPVLHEAEEPEIAPSLNIPLTGCSWHCVYCHTPALINGVDSGTRLEARTYSQIYEALAHPRVRSLSFVGGNPDQHLPAILDLLAAAPEGFDLPVVWNSNMYGSDALYRLLDGVVDVYVGDLRYGNDECAARLSGIASCWETVRRNWLAVAQQSVGLIARVLILPTHVECCAKPILKLIAQELPRARVSLLDQFHPAYATAHRAPEMARRPSPDEIARVRRMAQKLELRMVGVS